MAIKYKDISLSFGQDLSDICDELSAALEDSASTVMRKDALAKGQAKLKEWDGILQSLSEEQRQRAMKEFGEQMDYVKDCSEQIAGR